MLELNQKEIDTLYNAVDEPLIIPYESELIKATVTTIPKYVIEKRKDYKEQCEHCYTKLKTQRLLNGDNNKYILYCPICNYYKNIL